MGVNPRVAARTLSQALENSLAVVAMVVILRPAADYLPATWARTIARWIGLLVAVSPRGWVQSRTIARAFATGAAAGFRTWWNIQSRPLVDFVILRRALAGREDISTWEVTQFNAADVQQLQRAGTSFIVATGHFAREAYVCLYLSRVLSHRVATVLGPLPPPSLDTGAWRVRVNFAQILRALRFLRPADSELFFTGHRDRLRGRLIERLRSPRNVVINAIDARWTQQGSYRRPFAGEASRPLAVGTVTMARLSRCPIVPCIPVVLGHGQVRLHWGPVIPPPPVDDTAADQRITNTLLAFLEPAIGARPDQYVAPISYERRWDRPTATWQETDLSEATGSHPSSARGSSPATALKEWSRSRE